MNQIIITPKSEQEHSFILEMLKRMKIKATSVEKKPLRRMTIEEYRAMIEHSVACAEQGMVTEHQDLKQQIAGWR